MMILSRWLKREGKNGIKFVSLSLFLMGCVGKCFLLVGDEREKNSMSVGEFLA